jgi:Type II secretion system (T2SS), protein E, N-terminal domain
MPVLNRPGTALERRTANPSSPFPEPAERAPFPAAASRHYPLAGLLESCSNPGCGSGWLHLWRSRNAPLVEGGWTCSAACTAERLQAAVSRELDGRGSAVEKHRHRVPLGLLMLEQGWITASQLRGALQGQRENGAGRLGHWLIAKEGVSEQLVTRALGLQWSCPVLPLESHDPEGLAPLLPRLFVDAFGALPLRVAAGKLIYLGFEDRLDPVLALAVERISGLRVECGLVQGSLFQPARSRMLLAAFPHVELLEAASEPALVRALAKRVERARPVDSRLVRVHDCLWLRMWLRQQTGPLPDPTSIQDVICTIAGH